MAKRQELENDKKRIEATLAKESTPAAARPALEKALEAINKQLESAPKKPANAVVKPVSKKAPVKKTVKAKKALVKSALKKVKPVSKKHVATEDDCADLIAKYRKEKKQDKKRVSKRVAAGKPVKLRPSETIKNTADAVKNKVAEQEIKPIEVERSEVQLVKMIRTLLSALSPAKRKEWANNLKKDIDDAVKAMGSRAASVQKADLGLVLQQGSYDPRFDIYSDNFLGQGYADGGITNDDDFKFTEIKEALNKGYAQGGQMEVEKFSYRITAFVPTGYQLNSLTSFGMGFTKSGGGGFYASKDFDTKDEAKDFLRSRAQQLADTEEELSEMEEQIERGYLQYDACTAYIENITYDKYSEDVQIGNEYAKGGSVGYLNGKEKLLTFKKKDYTVNISAVNLEVDVNIIESDSVDQHGLTNTGADWTQHSWGYVIKPENEDQLFSVLDVLKVRYSKDKVKKVISGSDQYSDGGSTEENNLDVFGYKTEHFTTEAKDFFEKAIAEVGDDKDRQSELASSAKHADAFFDWVRKLIVLSKDEGCTVEDFSLAVDSALISQSFYGRSGLGEVLSFVAKDLYELAKAGKYQDGGETGNESDNFKTGGTVANFNDLAADDMHMLVGTFNPHVDVNPLIKAYSKAGIEMIPAKDDKFNYLFAKGKHPKEVKLKEGVMYKFGGSTDCGCNHKDGGELKGIEINKGDTVVLDAVEFPELEGKPYVVMAREFTSKKKDGSEKALMLELEGRDDERYNACYATKVEKHEDGGEMEGDNFSKGGIYKVKIIINYKDNDGIKTKIEFDDLNYAYSFTFDFDCTSVEVLGHGVYTVEQFQDAFSNDEFEMEGENFSKGGKTNNLPQKGIPEWHQIQIAKHTVNMTPQMASVMGGMSVPEAEKILNKYDSGSHSKRSDAADEVSKFRQTPDTVGKYMSPPSKEELAYITKGSIDKLLDAGFSENDIMAIFWGYSNVENPNIKADVEFSGDLGLLGMSEEKYVDEYIDEICKNAKKGIYQVGLKYPDFKNWEKIFKKHGISTTAKEKSIDRMSDGKLGSTSVFSIFSGSGFTLSTLINRTKYNDKGKVEYTDTYRKPHEGMEESSTGSAGYWAVVSRDFNKLKSFLKDCFASEKNYCKDLNYLYNGLGGLDADDLEKNAIHFAGGGSMELMSRVKDPKKENLLRQYKSEIKNATSIEEFDRLYDEMSEKVNALGGGHVQEWDEYASKIEFKLKGTNLGVGGVAGHGYNDINETPDFAEGGKVNSYQKIIIDATNCTPAEAVHIEEIMRKDIFHSTLDHQTKKQLQDAAEEGYEQYKEMKKLGLMK
jgi:hypothetical protein